MIILQEVSGLDRDRTEAFGEYARQRAAGAVVPTPTMLPPEERRLYVRRTLREDHTFRIKNRPEGAQAKFDKLAKSAFKFFRGTALLYYRDYAGTDAHLPVVFTIGDVHPENFGVMPNEDGAPFFGVNDFDEAYLAPFSYDVKRGAVGFFLAAREEGYSKKKARKIARAFVEGYLEGLREFARSDREKWHEYRIDNSPPLIRDLLESAQSSRKAFLAELIDPGKERFVSSKELVPHTKHVDVFQKAVDAYRKDNDVPQKNKAFYQVKDVAIKKDSGTASLGMDRYYVLLEGESEAGSDDLILEFKQARRSALYGLVPRADHEDGDVAEQIVEAQAVHLVGGDPFYGRVELDDIPVRVRERSPYKDDIDVDDLSKEEFLDYATICGKTLSQTHARSDEDTGVMEGDAEERILSSLRPTVFVDDVVRFAEAATRRLYADFKVFKKDHQLGVFNFVNQV
jgi:uncharacterized protein (DUF2252 family)